MFLDLADGNDICTAQVTPQSFHSGLRAKSVRYGINMWGGTVKSN